ncbi:hypothetical protein Tco_0560080, partial [Tanacetum coccineum]
TMADMNIPTDDVPAE